VSRREHELARRFHRGDRALHRVHGRRHLNQSRRRPRRARDPRRIDGARAARAELSRRSAPLHRDGQGDGIIASVTPAGLHARARGFTSCLSTADLKTPLRAGDSDEQLAQRIAGIWHAREDRYSEERAKGVDERERERVEMFRIGG
jgi:cyclic pyranopterin phosphate synthase